MPFLLPAAASAVAAAAPAAAASAAGAAASAGIGATLTSIAGNVLMNVAISAAMSVFQPQVGVAGRTFEWTLDPDGPIPFAAGRIGVPGSAVYRKTFGPDLMYYGIPSVLSGAGPIDGFEGFMADDETVTFDGSGKAVSSQYAGELWYKNKLGTQPDTAITSPTGLKNGATLPGWTSAHKLSGKACYMIVMGENSKGSAFPTGEIKPIITFRGLKVYDPRRDDTYPGGSGAHRLAEPATWTYSTNPILWALKWTLGLWEGPNGKGAPQVDYQVGGIGAKLSGIDVPAFVAAANVADANGWTCAAYPTTDDDKHQVLTGFLQAGGAIYAQRAGKISCIQRAAPRTSIVTISAYDTAGPLEIDTAASRIDRINTLRPRFWSEPHRWQMTALNQEVTAQAYRDEDGAVRTRGIDYPYVTNAVQAGQLAALQIANTREGIAGVIPLKPHLQRIRPGDAFTITEAGFVLNGLKCLCLNTDYDPATGVVRVSFVSETDAKYPFALGQNPTPPTPQVLTPVDPRFVSPPAAGDWTITPRPPSQGGAQQPGFDLTGFVSNETATAIIVETGPSATGPWKQAYQGPPTVTNIPIDGLQPGATYFIAIQYQRNQNYSEREVFGPFTAPELIAGDLSPESPVRIAVTEITDRLQGVEQVSAANAAAVADLETVYGDTASSAANAAQVAADKAAVIQAKADAIIAKDGAVSARADAILAKADAISAKQDSVAASGASATSASQAGGFKTAAEAAAAVSTSQKLEAVAALNAMGRQNLVARENVTNPADLFSVTTGGTSGWGFSMSGSGGNVTRSIKVGPLKVNTAYSISFKARRTSGSGSLLLDVDLFPDTLPGRTFDIQSSAWTEFKWENITSASADMALSTVMLRFFRTTLPNGYAYEITDIKLEEGATATAWTPSPKDAATSAKASAQSASQAFASETAAGQQASAASQDRQAAQTARGEAQGFRDQSSAAASTASGAAATATEQAGLAATARGEAQGFAGSALEYRNQASSFKTAAEAAAAVATSQKLEAVAALNAMGRQNLVARQNVTAGQAAAFGAGSLSGWGFSMVGTGTGSQERSITVGPLKRNTAYSVSILARRLAGSGSAPITCDFFPDTLPERTFDVQANAWTRFTWENITSASADMELSTVRLRFFRPNMAAGLNVEITDIKLEEGATATAWTPSAKDAPYSAAAAATSAASAAASETASGQNASATQADRIAAQTARGQAEGFRNQAVQASEDATAQASIATAQAGLSSGSATLAGQKADAAAGSAALASTKADEAGASAAASRADQISASAARDQALAALMAQGRQNLVARENVASGQLVAVSSGGVSGWGFSMVGSGGNVTRSIKVGPLKANTAYSISFMARRTSGSGSLPINVDLYPDTLPERTFDIQSSAWTEFKWENITSASADMALSTVMLRFFRAPLPAGYAYEITDIKLEEGATATAWTPSPKDAAYSASASATSAASAAASDTAAGQSATAASGSATTASTKAGEASTFASQASTSAGNAAGSATTASTASGVAVTARDQANDARDAAQGSAATALAQAANASASAASASISANLAASASAVRGNLLPNGGMERGLEGISGQNLYILNDSWGPAVRIVPNGNGTYGISWPAVNIFGGATYTVSGDARLFADSGSRYFDMVFLDAGGNIVRDGGEKPMGPGDYSNDRARINDMAWTEQAPSNATQVIVRAIFEGLVNPTAIGARRVKLELGAGPATAYTADAAIGALSSQLQITASTTADIATRMATAKFEVIAAAENDPAQLLIRADSSGSLAAMVATSIRLSNVVGGTIVEALRIENGKSKFFGDVEVMGGSMNFNNRFIVAQDGTTTIRSGQTGERMWIEGKTIKGWYANGQQAYQLG